MQVVRDTINRIGYCLGDEQTKQDMVEYCTREYDELVSQVEQVGDWIGGLVVVPAMTDAETDEEPPNPNN